MEKIKKTIEITKREYEYMKKQEIYMSEYGRLLVVDIRDPFVYDFFRPEVNVEGEGDEATYTFSWWYWDIDGKAEEGGNGESGDDGDDNGGDDVVPVIIYNDLIEIRDPDPIDYLSNGTSKDEIIEHLNNPLTKNIYGTITYENVSGTTQAIIGTATWDLSPLDQYDPTNTAEQQLVFIGTVTLKEGIYNTQNIPLITTVIVKVLAA